MRKQTITSKPAESLNNYGRIIGIDVGTKRIGLARTDLLRTVANPVGTFGPDEVIEKIRELVEKDTVLKFVVGWPLTPEGNEGEATKMVEQFVQRLQKHFPEMEIDKIDERYTSKEAVHAMIEAGVPKKKRSKKDRINRAAAAIILQKYLEMHQ